MIKRFALIALFVTCISKYSVAQISTDNPKLKLRNHSLYAELGGNSNLASFNYEHFIFNKKQGKHNLGIRLGVGISGNETKKLTLPLGVNYLFALYKRNVFVDAGLGCTYTKAFIHGFTVFKLNPNYIHTNFYNVVPSIGMRLQTNNGFFIRGSLLLIINDDGYPHMGVAFGKRF